MKFTNYLSEEGEPIFQKDLEKILDFVRKNCKPYLKEMGNVLLYRGISAWESLDHSIKKSSWIKNRIPMSTSKKVHDALNKKFKVMFGWPVRNGVFASSHDRAWAYGRGYIFFPIGNYKYCWSRKVGDLFGVVSCLKYYYECKDRKKHKTWAASSETLSCNCYLDQYITIVNDIFGTAYSVDEKWIDDTLLTIVQAYTDKHLKVASELGCEVSFNCKEYYLVDAAMKDELKAALK